MDTRRHAVPVPSGPVGSAGRSRPRPVRPPQELLLGQVHAALRPVGRGPTREEPRHVGGLAARRTDRALRARHRV